MRVYRSIILTFVVIFILAPLSLADIKLPAMISDNMVLQQKTAAPLWGWAEPGEKVTVKGNWSWLWGKSVYADKDGKWFVKLKTPSAGGPYTISFKGNNSITLSNVLIGEVWMCSGQSNMGWPVVMSLNADQEIKDANYPNLRLLTVPTKTAATPQSDCVASWTSCSPKTVPHFSAVAYFFGRYLHKELNIPIGLIHTSWGGTPAESWTKDEVLRSSEELMPIIDRYAAALKNLPAAMQEYNKQLKAWEIAAKQAKSENKKPPLRPNLPLGPDHPHSPSVLYNAMISPLIPYAVKGAIWYQGESNAGRAYQYRTLFPAMISNWRDDWQQDFTFLFVQLASLSRHAPQETVVPQKGLPKEDAWAELREAQLMALNLKKTGMAVAIDIGSTNDIHPKNKQDVGKRLALWALAKDYGKDIVCSGPLYKSMKIENDKIHISFDHVADGLVAKGDTLDGFAIAAADKKFVWADAHIDGDNVVVSSKDVPNPVAVRYAWDIYPFCNLFNKAGLPASPFRTDDWPCVTLNNK